MNILDNTFTAEIVLNLAFHSLAVSLVGWLLLCLFRQKSAPLRSGIVLMFILSLMTIPVLNFTSLPKEMLSLETELPIPMTPSQIRIAGSENELPFSTEQTQPGSPPSLLPVAESHTLNVSFPNRLFSGTTLIRILNGFGIAWALGSLFFLIYFLYGTLSLRIFKDGLAPITEGRIVTLFGSAQKSFAKPTRAQIFVSHEIHSPVAMGLAKPLIILPHGLVETLTDSEIKGILLHELSHIHHRDQIVGILQRLVTALNWWNPFVFVLSSDFSRIREEISDNHALLENNSKDYAKCLINLAEKASPFSRMPVFTGMASPHIPLKDRVKHILSKERTMETKLKKSTVFMIALAAVFFIGLVASYNLTFASVNGDTSISNEASFSQKSSVKPDDHSSPVSQEADEKKKEKKQETKAERKILIKPKLIKKVFPEYPEEAKKAGIEGFVSIQATTDKEGKVVNIKVKDGEHISLTEAAVDAVKQWEYEPILINEEPHSVTFIVNFRFRKDQENTVEVWTVPDTDKRIKVVDSYEHVFSVSEKEKPELIKKIEPVYPKEARKNLLGGEVVLEATIDEEGKVIAVKVKKGEHDVLNEAAADAVKQWIYKPFMKDGIPKKVRFTVILTFKVK